MRFKNTLVAQVAKAQNYTNKVTLQALASTEQTLNNRMQYKAK